MSNQPGYVSVNGFTDLVMCEICGSVVWTYSLHLHDGFHISVRSHGRDINKLADSTGTDMERP